MNSSSGQSIPALLADFRRLGIKLWCEGDRLRYKAPKGALTPPLRQQLRHRKSEIIRFFQQVHDDTEETIQPISRKERLPLSFAQQRLWFLDQFDQEDDQARAAYNMPAALRIEGALDLAIFSQSLHEIVRRHEALRTTFPMVNGVATQYIMPQLEIKIPVLDLSDDSEEAQEREVQRLAIEEQAALFDLANGPLLRVKLLYLGRHHHILLLTMHHIISDGWSIGVFMRELTALYEAYLAGRPSPLPELAIQYADFAHWQREWLTGEVLERQLSYWQKQLSGAPALLQLPTDRPRPSVQTFRGTTHSFALSERLSKQLRALSVECGATLFMTLQAAFATLLYRYAGQEKIVIGTPIANRNRVEIEPLIGFFVNTLALPTTFDAHSTFRDVLEQVRTLSFGAYKHQDLPFELLVERLQLKRTISHSPLFQVMFTLEQASQAGFEGNAAFTLANLHVTPLVIEDVTAQFDLSLTMRDNQKHPNGTQAASVVPASLTGIWEYNRDLFDSETIARLSGHFENLLEAIVANPFEQVSRLPLLSEQERQQLLVGWNQTEYEYQSDECLQQLFEAQVARTPDAIAVVCEEEALTYQELNQRANQFAHRLQQLGIGAEEIVGLCVERGIEMVIGVLAIFKAGGAYLPLDPTYPLERLAFILSDAQPKVLLTQRHVAKSFDDSLFNEFTLPQLYLDLIDPEQSFYNPVAQVTADHLAYVIYTSGSTGRPKGVLVEHRSIATHCRDMARAYQIEAGDRVLHFASLNFDPSIDQIWATLITGAGLVIRDRTWTPEEFSLRMQTHKFNIFELPPAYAQLLLSEWVNSPEWVQQQPPKLVNLGGDVFSPELIHLWRQLPLTNSRLINTYGPTEATITATIFDVMPDFDTSLGKVPIGQPTDNKTTYILDDALQPVPIGVPGELHIGGVCVARGYLNRPELSAEKFIANPFAPGRLYKTGDLSLYRADGQIEFLGRIDKQIKMRGFRIELGEIEAVLSQHEAVQETIVIIHEGKRGKQLVAYVVPKQDALRTPLESLNDQLRRFLQEKLPDYMVPNHFVRLDAMPLMPNGKINRNTLPAPEIQAKAATLPPRNEIEQILATIWSEMLGIKEVGIHDNFFALGGDSILSIQIITRAKQAGLHLTTKQLFQHQTIAELANVARAAKALQAEQGLVTGSVPLTPIQHWFFEEKLAEPHHYNQSLLLDVAPDLDAQHVPQLLFELIKHHDALRLRFEHIGQWQARQVLPRRQLIFRQVDLSTEKEPEQRLEQVIAETQASLNLSEGPLMQVVHFRFAESQPGRLLIVIHHLAIDGVSWRILIEDLEMAYQQLKQGQPIQLPAKTTSFKAWANLLTQQGPQLVADSLPYWQALSQFEVTSLPKDDPLARNTFGDTASISVYLDAENTQRLLKDVSSVYNTQINDLLLTALVQAFSQWTGQTNLLIELEGHGREDLFGEEDGNESQSVDLSRTIGWFTSIFPVRLELTPAQCDVLSLRCPEPAEGSERAGRPSKGSQEQELGDAIKSIKEQLRQIPQRGISYSILRYLTPHLRAVPQAEVTFNYLGQFDQLQSRDLILGLAQESNEPEHSPRATRSHLLDISGMIVKGRLEMSFIYNNQIHQPATMQRVADAFIDALSALIAHCQAPNAGGFTPSDFPLAGLDQDALAQLALLAGR